MSRILSAFVLCFLACDFAYAFETGRWISDVSSNGFEGELEIMREGCCDYQVSRIEFGKRTAGYLDMGCAIEGGEGQERDRGRRLDIYTQGELGFVIIRHEDYLQVIPNLTVNDLMCRKTGVPEWVRTYNNRDEMQKEISSLKWRKVENQLIQ
ncbi:MAG: hypothetical protein HDQ44_03305 [Desulfovibrio sp.]|nr:hypothetical protein [Desulfovibrio sp.]